MATPRSLRPPSPAVAGEGPGVGAILMLVTEHSDRLEEIVDASVAGGVNIVQLRDRGAPEKKLLATAARLRSIMQGQALLIVNGRVQVARDAGADGVHLPEMGDAVADARRILGDGVLIGRSVHSVKAAIKGERDGADYLIAGAIFETASHPCEPPAGMSLLREVCESVSVPVIAIGGITPENAGDCRSAGAAGIAVISGIMHAADPYAEAKRYRLALDEAYAKWVPIA